MRINSSVHCGLRRIIVFYFIMSVAGKSSNQLFIAGAVGGVAVSILNLPANSALIILAFNRNA